MSTCPEFPPSFVRPWKELLLSRQREQLGDLPNHHARDPECLITTSSPQTLYVGTGLSIFTRGILPAILNAESSVHFVTCYWAQSPTQEAIKDALLQLAASRRRSGTPQSTLSVTIGFSSWGLFQKLFHTSSRDGQLYPPSQWGKLGLPDQRTLAAAGIHLTVKSLFFTPFSVMHPKYVLIDGRSALVPSCNVSWESWFEGCIELHGHVVQTLLVFHERVWGGRQDARTIYADGPPREVLSCVHDGDAHTVDTANSESGFLAEEDEASAIRSLKVPSGDVIPTILLPSSHHRNPRFSFFPFLSQSNPPMTPLNAALLTLFANARRNITILTPNVTSWPVLHALLEALGRGVDVQVRTNKGMMLLEQLVTAGTTTSLCLRRFVNKYKRMRERRRPGDIEAPPVSLGKLEVLCYKPLLRRQGRGDEPLVSHFKMTMVDDEYLVLGSGNMDRASWWTSQELGVLMYVPGLDWHRLWDGVLERRMEVYYRS